MGRRSHVILADERRCCGGGTGEADRGLTCTFVPGKNVCHSYTEYASNPFCIRYWLIMMEEGEVAALTADNAVPKSVPHPWTRISPFSVRLDLRPEKPGRLHRRWPGTQCIPGAPSVIARQHEAGINTTPLRRVRALYETQVQTQLNW